MTAEVVVLDDRSRGALCVVSMATEWSPWGGKQAMRREAHEPQGASTLMIGEYLILVDLSILYRAYQYRRALPYITGTPYEYKYSYIHVPVCKVYSTSRLQ